MDGKGLVTIGDSSACHWDLIGGHLKKTVGLKLPQQYRRVCLSPDGQSLAVSPRGQEQVFLLDTTTGAERLKLQGKLALGGSGLAFSHDGKTLVTSPDVLTWYDRDDQAEVAFWDAATGKLLRHFSVPAGAALHLCLAPDGRTLVTAGQQPLVRLWDVATGKQVLSWSAKASLARLAMRQGNALP